MKAKWFLIPMAAVLVSCDKKEPAVPDTTPTAERKTLPAPTKIEPVAGTTPSLSAPAASAPGKPAEPSAPDAANAPAQATPKTPGVPTALPVPAKPGYVFSPYSNEVIDVRDMPPGTLVADPTFPASEKKHFRVPK